MALALTTKQHLWMTRGIKELLMIEIPSALFCDSEAAIGIAENPKTNDRSKHIDISYHFVRERVEDGTITIMHEQSGENLADICTKALLGPSHDYLSTRIFG